MHIHSFTSTLTHTQTHNLAYTSLHHCHAASISPRGPPGSEPLSLATVQGSNHDWWPVTHMITHTHTANEQMHCCAVSTRANTSLLTLLRSAGSRQSVFVELGMVFWCELVLSFQSATSRIQSPYIFALHLFFFFNLNTHKFLPLRDSQLKINGVVIFIVVFIVQPSSQIKIYPMWLRQKCSQSDVTHFVTFANFLPRPLTYHLVFTVLRPNRTHHHIQKNKRV